MLALVQVVVEGIRFNSMYRVYVDTNSVSPGDDYSQFWRSGFYTLVAVGACASTVMDGMACDDEEEEAEEYYEEYYEEVLDYYYEEVAAEEDDGDAYGGYGGYYGYYY